MKKISGMMIFLFLVASAINAEEPKYTNLSFARLSYVSGNTYIQRASDLGYEEGAKNTPISEGDRLGTTEGRAEIYLGRKNYIRIDENTKIDFMNLPKKGYDLVRIKAWTGNVYLNAGYLEKEKNIEIHTQDASIYVLDEGLYRIDILENKETEILVFRGLVEVSGEEGSILIKSEQKLAVRDGRWTSQPQTFYAVAEDSFDRWNESRDAQIAKRLAKTYLAEELEDFEYELAEYGDWVYVSPFGHVWVPRGMAHDWHPYFYGRWTWFPLCGWCWVPFEPWGWCTFHYGRWHWALGMGWYWIPTTIWGPAWISWWWDYGYYGWAPLSYWGYPVVVINNVFYGRGYYKNYPYNSGALTVIHKNQLQAKNISKVALSQEHLKKLDRIDFSKESPSFRPTTSPRVSIEQLEGQRVFLKKDRAPTEPETQRIKERDSTKARDSIKEREAIEPRIKETERTESQPPEKSSSGERKIKKREDTSDSVRGESESRSYSKGESFGYPSRDIRREGFSGEARSSQSSSFMDRFYRYLSERNSSSRGFSSRSSISRPPSMPKSFSAPSVSHRPSSSSRNSSRSGSARRKD